MGYNSVADNVSLS